MHRKRCSALVFLGAGLFLYIGFIPLSAQGMMKAKVGELYPAPWVQGGSGTNDRKGYAVEDVGATNSQSGEMIKKKLINLL